MTQVLDEARAAFARNDWESARDQFQRALDAETSGEALDGLGQAVWWLGEEEAAIELHDGPDRGAVASTVWSSFTDEGRGAA